MVPVARFNQYELLPKLNLGISKMKYYTISGEPSGDIYGSRLLMKSKI